MLTCAHAGIRRGRLAAPGKAAARGALDGGVCAKERQGQQEAGAAGSGRLDAVAVMTYACEAVMKTLVVHL